MGKAEAVELGLIVVAAFLTWSAASMLPDSVALGRLLLTGSALLLLQSLVRDLSILARRRRTDAPAKAEAAQCMCIESTVGAAGIVVGAGVIGAGVGFPVSMSGATWVSLVASVLVVGFLIKDFVFEWSPWRIRRDKDHMNIVFTLRK